MCNMFSSHNDSKGFSKVVSMVNCFQIYLEPARRLKEGPFVLEFFKPFLKDKVSFRLLRIPLNENAGFYEMCKYVPKPIFLEPSLSLKENLL